MNFIAQHDPTLLGDTPLLPTLEHIIPPAQIAVAVDAYIPPKSRHRKLFGDRLVPLLIAAFLLPMPALDHALDLMLLSHVPSGGGDPPATKGAISRARRRWSTAPFVTLFRSVCRPLATQEDAAAWRVSLRVIATDGTNREIAGALTIAERTVDTHVSKILGKLRLSSRVQLARWVVDR